MATSTCFIEPVSKNDTEGMLPDFRTCSKNIDESLEEDRQV